ncbi:MAG TPA: zinc ribbon domain-containing protein [bacterium]|nr:zinc ribbon domain-containing protein [bacterium]HPN41989.1 zinc ribbon domain-containing protein [bacterium]
MQHLNYTCPKCKNNQCQVGEIRTTGGFLTKVFDIQNKRFTSVTCTRCSYTEFYKADSSALGSIFDFFAGG